MLYGQFYVLLAHINFYLTKYKSKKVLTKLKPVFLGPPPKISEPTVELQLVHYTIKVQIFNGTK